MDRLNKILFFLSLYLQSHIVPVQCESIIGYTVTDGTTETFSCPSSASFRTTHTFIDDTDTYAHCDWFTADAGSSFEWRVGTYCSGSTAMFTHWTESGSGYSSSTVCDGDCVTVKLYENPDDLDGLRWLISCDDSIGVSTSISTLFLEYPTDWDTTTESTTTTSESTSESSTTETDSESSTETETTSSAMFPSSTSEPEEPESPTDEGAKGGGGPSGGVIAGAVVGSIAGVALIAGVIILAFKMGRRSRGDEQGPCGGFRDSLRSIPVLTSGSHQPEPKPTVPVIQPVFVEESQPYRNNSET